MVTQPGNCFATVSSRIVRRLWTFCGRRPRWWHSPAHSLPLEMAGDITVRGYTITTRSATSTQFVIVAGTLPRNTTRAGSGCSLACNWGPPSLCARRAFHDDRRLITGRRGTSCGSLSGLSAGLPGYPHRLLPVQAPRPIRLPNHHYS
jgi:hypothetical protein